jgi:hypothetical protein
LDGIYSRESHQKREKVPKHERIFDVAYSKHYFESTSWRFKGDAMVYSYLPELQAAWRAGE